jgi:hypothetical protein
MRCRDVLGLIGYWRYHPPMHELLAAYVGFKPPMDMAADAVTGQELAAALRTTAHRGQIKTKKVSGAKKYRELIMAGVKEMNKERGIDGG